MQARGFLNYRLNKVLLIEIYQLYINQTNSNKQIKKSGGQTRCQPKFWGGKAHPALLRTATVYATDQVALVLLPQDFEDSFSAKKAGAVFVDLTAGYDTVWHRVRPASYCNCYLRDRGGQPLLH